MQLISGQTIRTLSGRVTTCFPYIDCSTNRKCKNTLKRVDQWLLDNAIAEAKARNDQFNLRAFQAETVENLPPASKDAMHLYLFGTIH